MATSSQLPIPRIERRVRHAATLICLGLVVMLLTLIRVHPAAFMAFVLIACPLMLAGILLFLYSIVSHEPRAEKG